MICCFLVATRAEEGGPCTKPRATEFAFCIFRLSSLSPSFRSKKKKKKNSTSSSLLSPKQKKKKQFFTTLPSPHQPWPASSTTTPSSPECPSSPSWPCSGSSSWLPAPGRPTSTSRQTLKGGTAAARPTSGPLPSSSRPSSACAGQVRTGTCTTGAAGCTASPR